MQPEARLVKKIQTLLRQRGARPFKIWGSEDGPQEVGIPDLLVCYRGRFVGLEVKVPGGKPSRRQLLILDEIEAAGGVAACISTVEEVSHLLAKIDKEVDLARTPRASRGIRITSISPGSKRR